MRMILFSLVLVSAHLQAELNYDLSDVDPKSPEVDRYVAWATPALSNKPPYAFSATHAVDLYRLTNKAAWCQLATALIETEVSTAETAITLKQRPTIAADSYLGVGGSIQGVTLTYTYCPQVTAEQKTRWGAYAEQAVWNIWNPTQAKWGDTLHPWSGWGVSNPGNNYHYSFLRATMMWGFAKPAGGTDWIAWLRTNKIPQLIAYYTANGVGGGSREGTGYGMSHAALYGVYKIWKDNTPEHQDLANASIHLQDSVEYLVHATMPDLKRFAPIGDLSRVSYPSLYDYHRCYMMNARRQAPTAQAAQATWWLNRITPDKMNDGFNIWCGLYGSTVSEVAPTKLYHYSVSAGHLFARDSWTADAMWVGFVAGMFDESHAAQDQGSFTVFYKDFLAVTENIFSHSGIHQETDVQNVVRFEKSGAVLPQLRVNPPRQTTMAVAPGINGAITAEANLSPFYNTTDGVQWSRKLAAANKTVEIRDTLTLAAGTTAIWQLNTPVAPVKVTDNSYRAGGLLITVLAPANPQISVVDWQGNSSSEYSAGGYKLEVRGGTTEYRVLLAPDTAYVPPVVVPPPPPPPPPPVVLTPITGNVWFDDALPAGSVPQVENDRWNWVASNPTPFSGNLAHQSNVAAGIHQHYFTLATQSMALAADDLLTAYVYLDPINTPTEIMLQWNDGSNWERRAYWGADSIAWGTNNTISRRRIGDLPVAGQWVKLEVPATAVGLEGRTVRGMAFTLFGGSATWDLAGKAPAVIVEPPPADPTVALRTAIEALRVDIARLVLEKSVLSSANAGLIDVNTSLTTDRQTLAVVNAALQSQAVTPTADVSRLSAELTELQDEYQELKTRR